ncbi:MAG: CHAT domain-containing protein, partial [Chloroflexi bacterium]|nr:CHAT domain-containing protein [Chloroflexota bacterium]
MDYANFAIDVAQLPDGRFRINVQSSPAGEASIDVDSPFTAQEIATYMALFGRERKTTRDTLAQATREFGERLYRFLLLSSNEISSLYSVSLSQVYRRDDGLRIRLSVENAGPLAQLPWEYACDERDFLALSRSTPIVRYRPQLTLRPPIAVTLPLRVLVMLSGPTNYPALDLEGEWTRLQEATADLRARGILELERLDTATLIALQRRLRQGVYHVFHFVGHSEFDANTRQGTLVFEREGQQQIGQIVSGIALAREIGEESTIRLVVLNSCQSARSDQVDPQAGIASSIVTRGIPAVVANQFVITDRAAQHFAEEFYRALAEGLPIDSAVSEGRRAIANRIPNSSEWGTPVLYMRARDGQLFDQVVAGDIESPALPFTDETGTSATRSAASTPSLGPLPINRATIFGIGSLLIAAVLFLLLIITLITPPAVPTPTPSPTVAVENLPDIQIEDRLRISPRPPGPGEFFRVFITLTNAGESDTGPFVWAWDASVNRPVIRDAFIGEVDNIPPNASKSVSFLYSYGWWGDYQTQVRVDIDSEIVEGDEQNNFRFLPIEVARDVPFTIDFTRLANTQLVDPPQVLGSDDYIPWNLTFLVNTDNES